MPRRRSRSVSCPGKRKATGARGDLRFQHVVVDGDNPPDPHGKAAGDIDGDGYPDLLAASASGGGLFWYRYPDWSKHPIAEGTFPTDMAVADAPQLCARIPYHLTSHVRRRVEQGIRQRSNEG